MTIPVVDLVAQFGSPLYVYDLQDVRAAHQDLLSQLPTPSRLYYSLKANPHKDLVTELHRLGCQAEVSSVGELAAAVHGGFGPEAFLYTAPAKRTEDIRAAVGLGVRLFSVDSPGELHKVHTVAEAAGRQLDCLLRVNAEVAAGGMGISMTGQPSQFGADLSWILDRPSDFASTGSAQVVGVHVYMGSNIYDEGALLSTYRIGVAAAQRLHEEAGVPVRVLDLGGGFGSPYARRANRPHYARLREDLTSMLDSTFPNWRAGSPQIAFESGRYLVGGSGTLVCTVLDVKQSKGQQYVVLDAGINCLGGLAGLRRLPRVTPELVGASGLSRGPVNIVGPLCTPADYMGRGVDLSGVSAGDVLTIPNVGAYGLTASLIAFLGHPLPTEVVLDGDRMISATRSELVRADLTSRC